MKRKKEKLTDVLEVWGWPYLRRNFGGTIELECPCEVGHGGIHGCCGCCSHPSYKKALKEYRRIYGNS